MWKGEAQPRLTQRCTSWYATVSPAKLARRAKAVGPLCAWTRREIAGMCFFMTAIIPQQKRVRKFLLCVAQRFVVHDHSAMTENKQTAGVRIAVELAKNNVSKASFCREVGVSTETFRKWTTGETAPSRRRAGIIAGLLGKTPEWVSYGTESSDSEDSSSSANDNELLSRLSPVQGGGPGQGSIHLATTQTPLFSGVTWELFVNMLREGVDLSGGVWVVIEDDSNAPEINPGDEVYIVASLAARPGNYCVFDTSNKELVLRKFRKTVGHRFEAIAFNPNYAALDSERDGLIPLAVVTRHMRTLA